MDSCNNEITGGLPREALWKMLKERINRPGQFSVDNGILVTEVGDHWCRG